jgi:hypothetical protein
MKTVDIIGRFFGVWLVGTILFFSCETADNVEDPDPHYFIKMYGRDGDQRGVDMLALNDGSLLLLGNSSTTDLTSNVYVVRVSADGGVLWEKVFADDGHATAKDIEPTIDGNFIILADYIALDKDSSDVQLLKISPEGDLLATGFAGNGYNDRSLTVTPLAKGDFIVSGTTEFTDRPVNPNDPDPDLGDAFNLRFGPDLLELPANEWGPSIIGWGSNLDVAVKISQIHDSLFYVFGYTNSSFSGYNEDERFGLFYFARKGITGTTDKVFFPQNDVNNTRVEYVQTLPPSLGGGFIVLGSSVDNLGTSKLFMARLQASLTFQSISSDIPLYTAIAMGGRNIRGVHATPSLSGQFGFLILGNEVRATDPGNFWLSKVNQSGEEMWSATFGSEGQDDAAACVIELPDGKIAVLGTMGLADNQYKMALIKLNSEGRFLK